VKVSLGVGMQGARSERAQDVASREPDTLFGPLPELEQGVAWERLEPQRRERMLRDGWTPGDWEQALREARLPRRTG
jgi:hypothetical protein